MSNATNGGGGGSTPVELEFDSIDAAVSKMQKISDTIGTLQTTFSGFASGVQPSDWSNEESCRQFGSSYKAAVTVYAEVIAGMKQDLANYAAALRSASTEYKTSDDNAAAALTKLGTVDDGTLAQDGQGRSSYEDKPHHEVLSSDKPEQATDTTPNDTSGATTMPTAPADGSGSGSGANNATSGGNGSSGGGNPTSAPTGSSSGGKQ